MADVPHSMWTDSKIRSAVEKIKAQNGGRAVTTYAGHAEGANNSADFWIAGKEQGIQLSEWVMNNATNLGVKYIGFWQKIWNHTFEQPKPWSQWRGMEDRGSPTQNHHDHMHVTFLHDGQGVSNPDAVKTSNTSSSSDSSGGLIPDWFNPFKEALGPIGDFFSTVQSSIKFISEPKNWLRIAAFALGVVVLLVGLRGTLRNV